MDQLDALPVIQPTVTKHRRENVINTQSNTIKREFNINSLTSFFSCPADRQMIKAKT